MKKNGKKLISFVIVLSLLLSAFLPVQAAQVSDRVRVRLEALGLMQGYEDGSFGEDEELTRAQMAMIAARMLRMESASGEICPFSDVAQDHWAASVIATLSRMGVVNGLGDGTYAPERSVSYSEAVKMIVSVLGYEEWAEKAGGYPYGYLSQASKLGILKSIKIGEGAISRGEVAQILYDALSVSPIGSNFLENYPDKTKTLYEILADRKDLIQMKGILTETENVSIRSEKPTAKEGQIFLDNIRLSCDFSMDQYLGCALTAYVYTEDEGSSYRVESFFVDKNSSSIELNAEDVDWLGNMAVYYNEADREENIKLADTVRTVYNGRLADISAGGREISYGSYCFVDQDGDDETDVLMIREAQSFIIDKINVGNDTVYFRNRATLKGRNAIVLDKDDKSKVVVLEDADSKPLEVEDLEAGDGITIFASADDSYVRAVVSKAKVEGAITQVSDEEIGIDDELYKLAKKPDGSAYLKPKVGESAVYVLDMYGNVIDAEEDVVSSYLYAYVIDATNGKGLAKGLTLRTISGQKPRKEVKVSGDDETITYYFQNDLVKLYECAQTVYVNDEKCNASDLKASDFAKLMMAFSLNEEGKIKKMYTQETKSVNFPAHEFNAKILSFGGESLTRGYATDANTNIICIPEAVNCIDDYYVQVSVTDESAANRVYGTTFFLDSDVEDPDAEPADVLLMKAEMDSSTAPPIQLSSDICIVGEVSKVMGTIFDDADSVVYKITLLDGDQISTEVTSGDSKAASVAESLRKGDLIRYVKDGFGRIVNISKLVSVQGLGDEYSNSVYISSGVESAIYGPAYHVLPNTFDYFSNQMVDRLQLTFSRDGSASILSNEYRLFREDAPDIYKYDRKKGWISQGVVEDIRCYDQVGNDADKILAIIENNDIKALVIISD